MGVHGLTSFIDKNPHVLHSHQLRNCSVVIDGNNFYHYLYYACHVNCALGGDYDIYRKKLISTFKAFEKCGICPYIVLDGAYTVDNRKLKTSLVRASMRTTLVGVMARFGRGQILPILAYDTFMQVLTELGVRHVTCQFEADAEIAVLANKLKCPVISNDSDFYIFDLEAGFLPLDYIDFRPLHKEEAEAQHPEGAWYLHSQIYHVDDFINAFEGLSRPVLPVFACLLGNDFIKANAFDAFYSRLQVPKVISKKFDLPTRLLKIISVMHWFHVHNKDWSSLLQQILDFLRPQSQGRLREMFLASVNVYSNIDKFEGCDLFSYFHKESDFTPTSGPGFNGYNKAHFPKWFLTSVCQGEITPSTMNAAVLHRVILLSQVEDLSEVTSYKCSQGIRKVVYGILFNSDLPVGRSNCEESESNYMEECSSSVSLQTTSASDAGNEGESNLAEEVNEEEKDEAEEELEQEVARLMSKANQSKAVRKQTQVEEYNRNKRHMECWYIDPTLGINGKSLPSLSDIEAMSSEDGLNIVLSAFDVPKSCIDKFPDNVHLYACCLLVWLKNANPKVSERHLDCVILCLICLSLHDKLSCKLYQSKDASKKQKECEKRNAHGNRRGCVSGLEKKESENPGEIDLVQTLENVTGDQLQKIHQNLSKFHKNAPVFNHKLHMEPKILHAFAQLQTCMLDASNLNKLLRFPLPNIKPARLYNGTFLYNAFCDLISRPKPDIYLGLLLISDSPVHKFFLDFKLALQEFLPEDVFETAPQRHSKKSRNRQKKERAKEEKPSQEDVAKSSESDGEKEFTVISGFDISNKFSSLLCVD